MRAEGFLFAFFVFRFDRQACRRFFQFPFEVGDIARQATNGQGEDVFFNLGACYFRWVFRRSEVSDRFCFFGHGRRGRDRAEREGRD
jgi:hypothetical protein